jgi:hypothetical protein
MAELIEEANGKAHQYRIAPDVMRAGTNPNRWQRRAAYSDLGYERGCHDWRHRRHRYHVYGAATWAGIAWCTPPGETRVCRLFVVRTRRAVKDIPEWDGALPAAGENRGKAAARAQRIVLNRLGVLAAGEIAAAGQTFLTAQLAATLAGRDGADPATVAAAADWLEEHDLVNTHTKLFRAVSRADP